MSSLCQTPIKSGTEVKVMQLQLEFLYGSSNSGSAQASEYKT